MEYWIGIVYYGEILEGLFFFIIFVFKWSVFEVKGFLFESLQNLWKQIVFEWFLFNFYEYVGIFELEVYVGFYYVL